MSKLHLLDPASCLRKPSTRQTVSGEHLWHGPPVSSDEFRSTEPETSIYSGQGGPGSARAVRRCDVNSNDLAARHGRRRAPRDDPPVAQMTPAGYPLDRRRLTAAFQALRQGAIYRFDSCPGYCPRKPGGDDVCRKWKGTPQTDQLDQTGTPQAANAFSKQA